MRKKTNGIDSDDISGGQSTGNYTYDLIGNLISDNVEGINNITWNVYGKISSIDKASGPDLTFAYDPMGNRIMKLVDDGSTLIYTYYVRDAQGNVLSTYSRIDDATDDIITLSELHIYGSSRLGIMVEELDMSTTITSDGHSQRNLGKKRYELNNHLGNVLTVITDRRFGTEQGTTGLIKYYEADVLQAQDYYPFGMLTPGRNWSTGSEYRFGFNGQEQDDEIKGIGNSYNFLFRVYDPRLGRFLSTDPLEKEFAWNSPYAFAENRPIDGRDLEGKEWENIKASNKKPGELFIKLPNKETAQIQQYSISIQDSKKTYASLASDFKNSPAQLLSNSKATFHSPVDAEGKPSQFKVGSYIKVDIDAPFASGYIKVIEMAEKDGSMSATFVTMEGHIEKGLIRFTLTDKYDGKINFNINSMSEVDMGLAKTFAEGIAREKQSESWQEVLTNFVKTTGGTEVKRNLKVVDTKTSDKKEEK
ncbi:MAG: RHS repeat-associated core domain-containing protein [Chitinophagales bacterium]